MGEFRPIQSQDGRSFEAYVAGEPKVKAPGLIILSEIFNVNETIRGVADDYAVRGFVTMAPDMFWRQEPGLHMSYTRENSQRGLALYGSLDRARAVEDVAACASALHNSGLVNDKIAVMGFCMGGEVTLLAGCRLVMDAVVIYYGTRMEPHLDELQNLRAPTVMHFAELDPHVPLKTVEDIRSRTAGRPNVEVYVYEGADHGFARPHHPQYHPHSAALATQRSLQVLERLF